MSALGKFLSEHDRNCGKSTNPSYVPFECTCGCDEAVAELEAMREVIEAAREQHRIFERFVAAYHCDNHGFSRIQKCKDDECIYLHGLVADFVSAVAELDKVTK